MSGISQDVFIAAAARTAIGAYLGALSGISAPSLGSVALKGALKRSGLPAESLCEVILGCVLPAGLGQAPARQALRGAEIPDHVGAMTINKVCGSGLKATLLARQAILAGDAQYVLAGGMESMSRAPHYVHGMRNGVKMGHQTMQDGMVYDGLWDPYHDFHMGNAAEMCVQKYAMSREAQDAYALESYHRARHAVESGAFVSEIEPVLIPQRKGDPLKIDQDEQPFKDDPEKLGGLRPAFDRNNGTVTAGNASTLNDGAAALLVTDAEGLKGLANAQLAPMRMVATATHSQEPAWFTTAPVGAIQKALKKAGLTLDQIDCIELNEAFACVPMAAFAELHLTHERVNIRGGAVALGHPIGASGARILVTLCHLLHSTQKRYGLAAICNGGGEAVAVILENTACT